MDDFEKGYKKALYLHSQGYSINQGNDYVASVKKEIDLLNKSINQYKGYKTSSNKLKGNVAEQFHANTANIKAAVKEKTNRLIVPQSNKLASPDVITDDKTTSAGLKYYRNTKETLKQQAKTFGQRYEEYKKKSGKDISFEEYKAMKRLDKNTYPDKRIYYDQQLVIPKEQFNEFKKIIEENPELKEKYKDIVKSISDRIKANNLESEPLTTDEACIIAELAKDGDFDVEKFNAKFKLKNVIEFSDVLKKSAKSALAAATLSAILDMLPAIYKVVCEQLVGEGIDGSDFLEKGFDCMSVGGRSLTRGFISAFISIGCYTGKFGEPLQNVPSDAIAIATVVLMNAIENGFKVYYGKMQKEELVDNVLRDILASFGYVLGVRIGEKICSAIVAYVGTTIFGIIPVLGIIIGGIVGSMIGSFVYEKISNFVMALCVRKGYTVFGIVKQDYTLPIEVAKEVCEIIDIEQFEPDTVDIPEFEPDTVDIPEFEPDIVDIRFIKRGVISIGKIGYVCE